MSRVVRLRTRRGMALTAVLTLILAVVFANGGGVVLADMYTWIQDTQADFLSDTLTDTDAVTQPGSVLLEESGTLSVGGVPGWRYRRQVTVENNTTGALPVGYSVKLVLDTAGLVGGGKLRADGNDLRVVWDNGGTLVELDRVAETAFNAPDTEIWFKTQASIPGSGSDGDYYIYYGNPSAGAPPVDRGQVYALWDDFAGSSLDPRWTKSGTVFVSDGKAQLASGAYIIDTTAFTYGVLEMRLQLGAENNLAWWGWEGSPAGASNWVIFQETYAPYNFLASTRDNGLENYTLLSDPSEGLLVPHTYVVDWAPGLARWSIDGAQVWSTSSRVPDSGIFALFNARYVPMQVDWVKARLRVAQEPSLTLGTEQVGYVGQGQVLSIAYDAGFFASWKELTWDETVPSGTDISLRVRTAATQTGLGTASWVNYAQSGLPMTNDPGRWIQYEATLSTTDPLTTPVLHKVSISYEDIPATLTIAPDSSPVVAGEAATYTASVDDGRQTWDVTVETDFSIETGAGGSWLDNVYTSEVAGDWTVTGEYANLADTDTLQVVPAADLSVSKTSSTDELSVGETLTYTVVVTNNGPSAVADVGLTDVLPGDVTLSSATPSQGSGCSGTSTVVCPLGTLNDGAAATVTIVVVPNKAGMIENTAEASGSDTFGNPVSGSDSVPVTVIHSGTESDIEIAKLPDVQTVPSGSDVTFTIVVSNTGSTTLTDVTVTDALPKAADCNRSFASLAPGARTSYECTVDGNDVTGDFINRATVVGTTPLEDSVAATDTALVHVGGSPAPLDYWVYLPVVSVNYNVPAPGPSPEPTPGPDLVVHQLTVTGDGVQVVIKNQGNEPVDVGDVFWVDLYIAPDPVPSSVNQTWDMLGSEGMVWGIAAPGLPLQPGDTLTLTDGDAYYWPEYSNFSGSLAAGTPVYVQVDSANVNTTYGAVLENHEIAGGDYNNISGPVYATSAGSGRSGAGEGTGTQGDAVDRGRLDGTRVDRMPPRP